MIRANDTIFVDTGAWIALAITSDVHHQKARAIWESLGRIGSRILTSVPVIVETFTYLDRKGSREIALRWRDGLQEIRHFRTLPCTETDLQAAWPFLVKRSFHKLNLVDATSFVLMKKHRIRLAFAFDTHFAQAGFRYATNQP